MSSETERSPTPPRLPSLQRRLFVFAAAVLAPVLVGALVCGLLLLVSATRSQRLTEELVAESAVSLSLFQNLETARLVGSSYMEEGEQGDFVKFRAAAQRVDRGLDASVFDAGTERANLRRVEREWQAATRQLRDTRTGIGSARDNAADPEDVFEAL